MAAIRRHGVARVLMTSATVALLAGCAEQFNNLDFDLRDLGDGFDTSDAVANLPDRPRPDDRGIISYPNYQVALARNGDTLRSLADRLGLDAVALASFNGVEPDAPLRAQEVIALPGRVAEPSPETGATGTGPIQPLDVTAIATTALDRADAATPPAATATPAPQRGAEPVRYQVGRGDTAFSIARKFNIPVSSLAAWNTLNAELEIREGQFLLIPQGGTPAAAPSVADQPVTEPGVGSATPLPPSASTPLPEDTTDQELEAPATPDLGAGPAAVAVPSTPTAPAAIPEPASDDAQMVRPVSGTIIRGFAPGRSDGITIGVPAGTSVKAADAGTVAVVRTEQNGSALAVIRHADNLLTVYTNLTDVAVAKGDVLARGESFAKVNAGDPSFLYFEVRRGLEALDPADFLP